VILVVEDDDDVRELLELALRGKGYTVVSVADGMAALAALDRDRPCLMILDMIMPTMTGWDVLARMRAGDHGNVPVCVISALSHESPTEAVASLTKPFDMKILIELAKRYCIHEAAATGEGAAAAGR
jgi:DNA-binding response OmpR family regulator